MILLHTCFTLGTSIAPLVTAPFLSQNDTSNANTPHGDSLHDDVYNNSTNDGVTSSHVRIPYGLFGIWTFSFGLIFLGFFISGSRYASVKSQGQRTRLRQMLNPATCAQGKLFFGLYFVVSLLFLYIFVNGAQRALPNFLFAMANKGLGVSKTEAALILTMYGFTGAVGRGACAVISKYVNIKLLLFIQVLAGFVLSMYLMFYGMTSPVALGVISCLLTLMTAPRNPLQRD